MYISILDKLQHTDNFRGSHLSSYEAACQADTAVRTFDSMIQVRTSRAINSMVLGHLIPFLSLDSILEVTEYLPEIDPEVPNIFLENKKDNIELSNLIDDYSQKRLQTLKVSTALDICLERGGYIESIMNVALRVFKEEDYSISGEGCVKIYPRTLEELRNLKSAVYPFIEFLELFTSIYKHQDLMTKKLEAKKRKLDKKLRKMKVRRKVSNVISVSTFASVLICSVVAAAVIAPPAATALATAAAVPSGTMGKRLKSIFMKREMDLRGKREIITLMHTGTVIKKMDVDRFRIKIEELLGCVDFATREEGSPVIAVEENQKKVNGFMKTIQALSEHVDKCTQKIRMARNLILRKIMNQNFGMS